jgi:hypothetical protein
MVTPRDVHCGPTARRRAVRPPLRASTLGLMASSGSGPRSRPRAADLRRDPLRRGNNAMSAHPISRSRQARASLRDTLNVIPQARNADPPAAPPGHGFGCLRHRHAGRLVRRQPNAQQFARGRETPFSARPASSASLRTDSLASNATVRERAVDHADTRWLRAVLAVATILAALARPHGTTWRHQWRPDIAPRQAW